MILFKSEDLGISAKNYANNSENKKRTVWEFQSESSKMSLLYQQEKSENFSYPQNRKSFSRMMLDAV